MESNLFFPITIGYGEHIILIVFCKIKRMDILINIVSQYLVNHAFFFSISENRNIA